MNRELNLFENYMKMTRFNVDDLDILCKLDDFLLPHTPQSLDEDVTAEPMSYQEEQLLKVISLHPVIIWTLCRTQEFRILSDPLMRGGYLMTVSRG